MLQLGGLLPQLSPGPHLNNWVDWNTLAQGNNSSTEVATPGIEPGTFDYQAGAHTTETIEVEPSKG